MKIGDVVVPRQDCGVVLACGSGRYTHAIVANTDPFVLVSEEGDMIWELEPADDYIALCQAHPDIVKVALNRWVEEREKYSHSDPSKYIFMESQRDAVCNGKLCPVCLSKRIKKGGCSPTFTEVNQRYECLDCHEGWEGY